MNINMFLNNIYAIHIVLPIILTTTLVFFQRARISVILTQIFLIISCTLSLVIFYLIYFKVQEVSYLFGNFSPIVGIEYKYNKVNSLILLLTTFIATIGYFWGRKLLFIEVELNKIYLFNILYLIFYIGLLGILGSNDLFNIFIFTEISSISCYTLIAMNRISRSSPYSALNYLIISSIGTSLYVLGIGIIYTLTGSLNIDIVATKLLTIHNSPAISMALVLIIIFIIIKIGIFPFSVWIPKIYIDSPYSFNPFMCSIAGKIILIAFIKIALIICPTLNDKQLNFYNYALYIIAWSTILLGSIVAIFQTNLKSILAWSSISYIGYIFLAIFNINQNLYVAALMLIIWHSITKACLFMIAGNINLIIESNDINKFGDLHKKSIITFIAFLILGLNLIGFPGTLGFTVKWNLIITLINKKDIVSAVIIIISSAISIIYLWNILNRIIFNKKYTNYKEDKKLPLYINILTILIIIFIIILGICGNSLLEFLYNTVCNTVFIF